MAWIKTGPLKVTQTIQAACDLERDSIHVIVPSQVISDRNPWDLSRRYSLKVYAM